jgi:hypothetical protein
MEQIGRIKIDQDVEGHLAGGNANEPVDEDSTLTPAARSHANRATSEHPRATP